MVVGGNLPAETGSPPTKKEGKIGVLRMVLVFGRV